MREQGRPKQSAEEPSRPVGPALSPPGADGYFDHAAAARYDEMEGPMFDPSLIAVTVDVLKTLGDGGRALEFGIGTGRIALPLAAEGVEVAGIELSVR